MYAWAFLFTRSHHSCLFLWGHVLVWASIYFASPLVSRRLKFNKFSGSLPDGIGRMGLLTHLWVTLFWGGVTLHLAEWSCIALDCVIVQKHVTIPSRGVSHVETRLCYIVYVLLLACMRKTVLLYSIALLTKWSRFGSTACVHLLCLCRDIAYNGITGRLPESMSDMTSLRVMWAHD